MILLDINMPEMDGFEVFEKIKGTVPYANIPVIFLTADNSPETETRCFRVGAIDFVGKPFIADVLISRVNRTLELEAYHNRHTNYGHEVLEDILGDIEEPAYTRIAQEIALGHHERWDGRGYPNGLKGEEIPIGARIMSIADVFDALYEERCYKPSIRPLHKVIEIISENAGTQFDPEMAKVFCSLEDELSQILDKKQED